MTQEGSNVTVSAVVGNFDDAQTGVKNIFRHQKPGQLLVVNLENDYTKKMADEVNGQTVRFFSSKTVLPNLLNAIGRSDLFMKVDLSKIPLILVVLAITIPISVEAMVWGSLFNTFVCFFINTYYPGKLFGYGAWQQIKDWKYIFLSLLIMAIVVILYLQCMDNVWIQFIGGGIIGCLTYIICCFKFKVIDWATIQSFRKR